MSKTTQAAEVTAATLTLGDYIEGRDLTQDAVAKRLGVTQAAVSRWLSTPSRRIRVELYKDGNIDIVENKVIATSRKRRARK